MTSKELTWIGIGLAGFGIWYELYASPKAQVRRASTLNAGRNLGPLGNRPLNDSYNVLSPYPAAKMSTATPYTIANPSPGASGGGGLKSLGVALNTLFSGIGASLKGIGATSAPSSKGNAGGTGGQAGNANTGWGISAPTGRSNNQLPASQQGGGANPTGLSPYVDENGNVSYPQGDGTYQDEYGNQVWIDANGHQTYDQTQDVGYVQGGTPDLTDQSTLTLAQVQQGAGVMPSPADPNGGGLYLAPQDPAAPTNQSPLSDQGDTGPAAAFDSSIYGGGYSETYDPTQDPNAIQAGVIAQGDPAGVFDPSFDDASFL